MTTVRFSSSDGFMETEPRAVEFADVEVEEYVEGTYFELRTGPNGDPIAHFTGDAWELIDGRRFSDWAVRVA